VEWLCGSATGGCATRARVKVTRKHLLASEMKNRATLWLTILLLSSLPLLAHASEVGHIMDSVFGLVKLAACLLMVALLAVFLIAKLLTRK
jgi:hypothetical protein